LIAIVQASDLRDSNTLLLPAGCIGRELGHSVSYCYYYTHLERYADGLPDGMPISLGEVMGHIESTGNASPDAPHLHLAIYLLGPQKRRWKGIPINSYPRLSVH
jgi:hypothetical protein